MYTLLNMIAFVRSALVVLFVGVALLILAGGILRRSRFKDVRMSWPTGRLFGLPLGPTLFLGVVLILVAHAVVTEGEVFSMSWMMTGGYVCGGLFWYVGAMLSGATVVTDAGISSRFGRRHIMLPWHEVTDYMITQYRRKHRYVFFRLDAKGRKQRVEVFVPLGVRERFQAIVEFRLDSRFDRSILRSMGRQPLEH